MVELFQKPKPMAAKGASVPVTQTAASTRVARPPTDRPSIYVATPAYGCLLNLQFLTSMIRLHQLSRQKGIVTFFDCLGQESLITRARNVLCERFLRSPASHLMFIDADIGFDPQSVFRLLEADKDCATGTYSKKAINFDLVKKKLADVSTEPVHQMGLDFNLNIPGTRAEAVNGFVRVLDSATGFMLIKRCVFSDLEHKLPGTIRKVRNDSIGLAIDEYKVYFDCIVDPDSKRYLSEDFTFCRWMQQAGLEVWTDITAPLLHVGCMEVRGKPMQRLASLKTA